MKPQLFLLHFAGGNCYSFQFMASMLREFEVVTLELPGRGKRMGEELLKDFDAAAEDLYKQFMQKLTSPTYIIYGHSMGAYLALKVSQMLEAAGKSPSYVVVSGNAGPGIVYENQKKRYKMNQADFIEELKKIGGVPTELLENEELFTFFEPVLRADFEISEENGMENAPAVKAPLYALMGSNEEKVGEISNWGRFTRSSFRFEVLEGDHFFIHKHPRRIATILKSCIPA